MSLVTWIGMTAAGAIGALARLVADRLVTRAHRGSYPLGILLVNLTGTFALGLLTGAGVNATALFVTGTGFLGGYTTFSTWMLDARRLVDARLRRIAALDLLLSMGLGLACAAAGWGLGGVFV